MTELALDPACQFAAATANSDITHDVCCLDEDAETGRVTMCGLALPDGDDSAIADGIEPTCVVCQDLLGKWAEYGDLYHEDPRQPVVEPCRVCPRSHGEGECG